ncbi:MAG TPA: hypothetical protein VFU98_16095 [Microlunatus sp.]|nr:hypothetical protein [Microlunatus sp.]
MEPTRGRGRPGLLWPGAGSVLLALLLAWSAALPAAAETVEFRIGDSRITESSGLATDAANDRYWTVNDSGDSGIAYALDDGGDVTGTLEFRAEPVDVEAVAFHDGRLYVADIGDNRERRELVSVYFFDDAEPAEQPVVFKAYDFAYPDGPHDAETLLVDGDGRLFIVTKGATAGIYAAPSDPQRQGVNRLERVADAPPYVTDGTVLPDGGLALRTYVSVEILDPRTYEVTARAATPVQRQGESITTTLDGKALLIGSEGKRSEVLRIDIPTSLGEAPSASAEPPATESADPTPTESSEPTATTEPSPTGTGRATPDGTASPSGGEESAAAEEEPEAASSPADRAGTLAALGIAAVVALTAAGVVILVRRT